MQGGSGPRADSRRVEENAQLKELVIELSLDKAVSSDVRNI